MPISFKKLKQILIFVLPLDLHDIELGEGWMGKAIGGGIPDNTCR
jgi:hypothetical protein